MPNHKTRSRLLKGALLATAASLALSSAAMAQTRHFDIPSQDAAKALQQYALQSGRQVLFPYDAAAGRTAPAIRGDMTPDAALAMIAESAGLRVEINDGDTVTLRPVNQDPQGGSADAGAGNDVEALIVTAQKKEEAIQDVPIAISAFSQKSLDAQKIEGGFDLLKAIPNVTFSKNNFSGYNFSIRGIGTKAVSATTDPGVAVSFNNTTLIVNRLFEQEYFDVERVEVLRGPQGTLYGRNATSGVINVLSARPRLGEFEGDIKLETGNYNTQRARGMVNVPIGETLALRVAGAMTKRDGYGVNEFDGSDVDDRNLWSLRATLMWEPIEQVRVNLLWERFKEDDQRVRTSKQLCTFDEGGLGRTAYVGGNLYSDGVLGGATSQGCLPGSLYDEKAYGVPNGASLPYIFSQAATIAFGPFLPGALPDGATIGSFVKEGDYVFGGKDTRQTRDLRSIYSELQPTYKADADIGELSIDVDLTDSLTLSSQTVYVKDGYYAQQDLNRLKSHHLVQDSGGNPDKDFFGLRSGLISVGGLFCDPQLGCSDTVVGQDLSRVSSRQFNQEVRLVSSFDGPVNFSLGANYTRFQTMNDYFVFINALSAIAHGLPFFVPTTNSPDFVDPFCDEPLTSVNANDWLFTCGAFYMDRNPLESIDGDGHNYFRSANPYKLHSAGLFGEVYWQATEELKVTAGLRMTWDRKIFTPVPSQLFLGDYRIGSPYLLTKLPPGASVGDCTNKVVCQFVGTGLEGKGYPSEPDINQVWREPTGRLGIDWKPQLGFTEQTMIYGFYSRGYKAGGANPPQIARPSRDFLGSPDAPATFDAEYVNAFEIGTKNTLLDGAATLNMSAFYYDYMGYQVSKIVNRTAANENFDAEVWGLELEWRYSPARNLTLNGTVGYLDTRIAQGETSLDVMDRTQGGHMPFTAADGHVYTEWMVMKPWVVQPSNCIAPVELVEAFLLNAGVQAVQGIVKFCPAGDLNGNNFQISPVPGTTRTYNPAVDAPNGGYGFDADVSNNELPNAPHFTVSVGGQYRMALPGGWDATLRGDFYWQSQSFARVYNTIYDKLHPWSNTNISLWFEQPDWGVKAEVYVKNAFDESPITDAFVLSDDVGLVTNVFTLDPRLVGVSVRKSF